MNEMNRRRLTFALLDKEKGIAGLPPATGEEYPLPAWYRSVREIPLEELGVEDICKACRQQIHPEYVVPIVLRLLQSEPLAGEMYDGELLVSLKSIPPNYWSKHPDEAQVLKSVVEQALQIRTTTNDLRQDAEELLRRAVSHR